MKNKFASRVAAGALAFAMVATTVVGGYSDVYAATKTDAVKTVVTVSTQKKLNAALKKDHVKRVIIKTKKAVDFKISSVSYYKKKLTVNAPKSIVVNYGDFKKVYVKDAKKYIEKGEGNDLLIKDSNKLILTVPKNVYTNSVNLAGAGGEITLNGAGTLDTLIITNYTKLTMAKNITINKLIVLCDADLKINGAVNEISVENAGTVLKITGNTTVTPKVTVNGENSVIESNVKVDVKANANIEVKLDEGAKGSTVDAAKGVETKIDNQTGEEVKTSKSESTDKKDSTSGGSSSSSTSGGSSSGSTTGSTALELKLTSSGVNLKAVKSGDTLTANVTSGAVNPTYEWYRGSDKLPNETSSTYTVKQQDEGSIIKVKVTGTVDGEECAAEASITKNVWRLVRSAYVKPYCTKEKDPQKIASAMNGETDYTKVILSDGNGETLERNITWSTARVLDFAPGKNTISGYYNLSGVDGWYTNNGRVDADVYVQGSTALNLTFAKKNSGDNFVVTQNSGNKVFVSGCAVYAKDVTLTISLPGGTNNTLYYQDGETWTACSNKEYMLHLKDMITKDIFVTFRTGSSAGTTDNNETTYSFIFDWKKLEVTSLDQKEEELNLGSFSYGKYMKLESLTTLNEDKLVLPELITVNVEGEAETRDISVESWKVEKEVNGSWIRKDFDGSVGEWRFTPEFGEYVTLTQECKVKPYTLIVTKGKYTVKAASVTGTADASAKTLSFDVAEGLQNGYSFKIVYNDNTIEGKIDNGKVTFDLESNWAYDKTYEVQYCRNEDENDYESDWVAYGIARTQKLITAFTPFPSLDAKEKNAELQSEVEATIDKKNEKVLITAWNILSGNVTVSGSTLTFNEGTTTCTLQATIDTNKYALGTGVELPILTATCNNAEIKKN